MIPLGFYVFLRKWWKVIPGFVAGVLLCLPLAYCKGSADTKARMEAAQARADRLWAKRQAKAIDEAAEARVAQIIANMAKSQERSDAIHSAPAGAVSAAECRLNRERLRQAGVPVSKLPACAGSGGRP